MRTPVLALAAGALAAGLVVAPSSSAAEPVVTNGCVASVPETDPLEAGPVQICYTLYKPGSASAQAPVPMVLHSHGWGGSRTSNPSAFGSWMEAGFGVLSFDQRGFGQSGGKAHVEDPAFEGEDVDRIVDLVASLDWVKKEEGDPTDPVLAAIGGSYGGGYQLVGAFSEMARTGGTTRFDALAPEITWYDLGESLAPQDVVRTTWTAALYAAGAGAHTSTVHAGLAEGTATGQWPATMREFFADNGPAFHVAQGRRLDLPVLFRQGASDNLFPLDQGIKIFDRALTDEARAKSIFTGYNGGHALPNALPAGTASGSDSCSATLGIEGASFERVTQQFFKEALLGAAPVLKGRGQYHLTTAGGRCLTVDSVDADTAVELAGPVVSTAAGGAPQAVEVAQGPLTVAGTPFVDATVTALGLDARAFFALSVGTSPADARVVQNNVLPYRSASLDLGSPRSIELPSVAVEVPAGQKLFLTVSPVSDMFAGHGSRLPAGLVLDDVVVRLPVVQPAS
jgi:ABC-2 type transport system ATP-binding protein